MSYIVPSLCQSVHRNILNLAVSHVLGEVLADVGLVEFQVGTLLLRFRGVIFFIPEFRES